MDRLGQITATFKIVTPMFLGDAERRATRLSLASFKGQLRWWWRALAWVEVRAGSADDGTALERLWEREAELFGSAAEQDAARRPVGGQGRLLLGWPSGPPAVGVLRGRGAGRPGEILFPGRDWIGLRYLGYGVIQTARNGGENLAEGELLRDAFKPDQRFSVRLARRPDMSDDTWREVRRALRLLGLLGGLGSRWRRGFGSLSLERIESNVADWCWERRQGGEGYRKDLEAALPDKGSILALPLPPLTAFSREARVAFLAYPLSAQHLLAWIGEEMQALRSWGYVTPGNPIHTLGRQDALQLFPDDHDFPGGPASRKLPERAVFGLPYVYEKYNVRIEPELEGSSRRASPLLVHVHALDDAGKEHACALSILPATFLPAPGRIEVKPSGGPRPFAPCWTVLHQLLDGRPHPTDPGRSHLGLPGAPERVELLP